jgi:hypothetical protein
MLPPPFATLVSWIASLIIHDRGLSVFATVVRGDGGFLIVHVRVQFCYWKMLFIVCECPYSADFAGAYRVSVVSRYTVGMKRWWRWEMCRWRGDERNQSSWAFASQSYKEEVRGPYVQFFYASLIR